MSDWEDAKRTAQSPFHGESVGQDNKMSFHFSAAIIKSSTALKITQSSTTLREVPPGRHDHTIRMSIEQSFIVAPEDSPTWVYDREELWNRAELAEYGKNAPQIARAITLALPHELSEEGHTQLVRSFVEDAFVKQGMVADVAIGYRNSLDYDRPPYARVLLTMRELDGENFAARKQRDWNSLEALQAWRQSWTEYQDDALKRQPSVPEPEQYRDLEPDL